MSTVMRVPVKWRANGTNTILGKASARDATGATQASGRNLLLQADVSTISLTVYNLSDNESVVSGPTSLTIASVVFNTLQTDWDADSTGYNFRTNLAHTIITLPGVEYLARVTVTTTGGTVAILEWAGIAE